MGTPGEDWAFLLRETKHKFIFIKSSQAIDSKLFGVTPGTANLNLGFSKLEAGDISFENVRGVVIRCAQPISIQKARKKSPDTFAHLLNFLQIVSAMFDNHTIL